MEGAECSGANGGFNGAMTGNHDQRGSALHGLNATEGLEAVNAGEPDVQKNNIEIARSCTGQRFFSGGDGINLVPLVLENGSERFADAGFVIDNKEIRAAGHREFSAPLRSVTEEGANSVAGNSTRKREPVG